MRNVEYRGQSVCTVQYREAICVYCTVYEAKFMCTLQNSEELFLCTLQYREAQCG